ncbi:glycosyltransferase family 4 protein [Lachnospiraceae bacterium 38-10]
MRKVVLLTNILPPYRSVFYEYMYQRGKNKGIDFKVLLMSDTENGRNWKYEEYKGGYSRLLQKKVFFGKEDLLYINTDLSKCLTEISPDILVLAGSYTLLPVWQAKRWGAKNKKCQVYFWSESHLDETRNYNKWKYCIREYVRKNFYKKMDGFWYPGEKAKELIRKYAKEKAKYICVPNLVENLKYIRLAEQCDGHAEELRKKYGISLDKKIFFAPMRLIKVKGLLPFLELVEKVENKNKMQIVIAGEGELEEKIRSSSVEKDIDIKLLGYKNSNEVAELFFCSDVFFMPSISDANPLSCIEALWCKKVMLVSRHVGNALEVVVEDKNGYIFSYEKPEEAVGYIEALLMKSQEWYEAAEKISAGIAQEKFDVIENTDRILEDMWRLNKSE